MEVGLVNTPYPVLGLLKSTLALFSSCPTFNESDYQGPNFYLFSYLLTDFVVVRTSFASLTLGRLLIQPGFLDPLLENLEGGGRFVRFF